MEWWRAWESGGGAEKVRNGRHDDACSPNHQESGPMPESLSLDSVAIRMLHSFEASAWLASERAIGSMEASGKC